MEEAQLRAAIDELAQAFSVVVPLKRLTAVVQATDGDIAESGGRAQGAQG